MRPSLGSVPSAQILIIDDEPVANRLHARLLESQGHKLAQVTSAAAAFSAMRSSPPDLIVCDVMMPTMDGIEFAHLARSTPELRDVPIILISGLADRETRIRAR